MPVESCGYKAAEAHPQGAAGDCLTEGEFMSVYSDRSRGFEAGQKATKRPGFITDEYLAFLDDLRESGVTNMWGARPYLMDEFPALTEEDASTVLSYWMKTFGDDNR